MNVILLEKVGKLGGVGDLVNVKSGYARNYLFPYTKAIPATKENQADFEARRSELLKASNEKLAAAQARADKLDGVSITIAANVGEEGKLFGSVGTRDIVETLAASGQEVAKSEVLLPLGAIREVGEYDISIDLGCEISATIKLAVVPQ